MKKSIINLIFDLKFSCMAKEDNIIKSLGLSPAEYRGILSLVPGSEAPCSILSRKMGLSVSRGSRIVSKLINNNYLQVVKTEGDKRALKVKLTAKGVKTQQKINNMLEECEHIILKKMSVSEIDTLTNSLSKISEILITK